MAVSLDSGKPSIHIKPGTKLASVAQVNKGLVKNAVGALDKAQEHGDQAAANAVISDVAGTQGTYYHKTGPVAPITINDAKKDLTAFASKVGTAHKKGTKDVPGEALRVYHDALVKNAVKIAVNKVAEIRHKKDAVDQLKVSGKAVPALPQEELLADEVKAAKDVRDATVKDMAGGN